MTKILPIKLNKKLRRPVADYIVAMHPIAVCFGAIAIFTAYFANGAHS